MSRLVPTGVVIASLLPAGVAAQGPGHFAQSGNMVSLASRSKKIARCVLNRSRTASRNLVLSNDFADVRHGEREAIEQAMVGCMSARDASITVNAFDLRGDLAEDMLTENDAVLLKTAGAATPRAASRLAGDVTEGAVMDCAVKADPTDGVAMIAAPAETPAETATFSKLLPFVQACVPMNFELHLKPYQVRRLVAISLYGLANGSAANAEKN